VSPTQSTARVTSPGQSRLLSPGSTTQFAIMPRPSSEVAPAKLRLPPRYHSTASLPACPQLSPESSGVLDDVLPATTPAVARASPDLIQEHMHCGVDLHGAGFPLLHRLCSVELGQPLSIGVFVIQRSRAAHWILVGMTGSVATPVLMLCRLSHRSVLAHLSNHSKMQN
jgi:hypothetical protein